jgi:multidrug efflux system membrane fusion protein
LDPWILDPLDPFSQLIGRRTRKGTQMKNLLPVIMGNPVAKRIVICTAILLFGIVGMVSLAALKKPPLEAKTKELPIRVEVLNVKRETVPVTITGYGETRALNTVVIAPEVTGKIVEVHPRLETGEIIPAGEILFRIDPRNYAANAANARATVKQLENTVLRMQKQYEIDRKRLKTLERNRDLAASEFQRLKDLLEKDTIGTRSGVDNAEKAANSATDQLDLMNQALELYPIQIQEAKSGLAAGRASLDLARANLERCEVRAPFTGRISAVALETGQFVSPGFGAVTLANDTMLEILVPLDSRDARKWLQFGGPTNTDSAWFQNLTQTPCKIKWTEFPDTQTWEGFLHRVVTFDQKTRTVTVAVKIPAAMAVSGSGSFPLVEGMFCSVEIPGRAMKNVFRLPRWAVSFSNRVYTVKDNRLKTVSVTVVRSQGEQTFVSQGLQEGDRVITTRLVDPLENSLLEIVDKKQGERLKAEGIG